MKMKNMTVSHFCQGRTGNFCPGSLGMGPHSELVAAMEVHQWNTQAREQTVHFHQDFSTNPQQSTASTVYLRTFLSDLWKPEVTLVIAGGPEGQLQLYRLCLSWKRTWTEI